MQLAGVNEGGAAGIDDGGFSGDGDGELAPHDEEELFMRVLMGRVRRTARGERGLVDFEVVVGVGHAVKDGARGIGAILVHGEGIEGFRERWNGGERLICGGGISCKRGGGGEG